MEPTCQRLTTHLIFFLTFPLPSSLSASSFSPFRRLSPPCFYLPHCWRAWHPLRHHLRALRLHLAATAPQPHPYDHWQGVHKLNRKTRYNSYSKTEKASQIWNGLGPAVGKKETGPDPVQKWQLTRTAPQTTRSELRGPAV